MYDPKRDEPKYSEREVGEIIERVIRRSWEVFADLLADTPLEIRGQWEPDVVYPVNTVAYHAGDRWLSLAETSGEPGRGPWRKLTPHTHHAPPPAV
jgi:hypothetical protein